MRFTKAVIGCLLAGVASFAVSAPASALSLRDAIQIALETNPEIGVAIENREAIEFELRQAQGLFLPRVDLEASAGARRFDSPGRRLQGIDDRTLHPTEIGISVTQRLFDGFEARSQVERQASRVDGASFRVLERSEFIALQIAREYFEVLLQARIVGLAGENVGTHERILSEIRAGEREGTLTAADLQQAQERVFANRARLIEAQEELAAAQARFLTLVGRQLTNPSVPPSLRGRLPGSLEHAIELSRLSNPRVLASRADVDAADAVKREAAAAFYPELFLEGRARTGRDLDGTETDTTDVSGRVVLRFNLFDGGIKSANYQEQLRRASEERIRLVQTFREVEEAVRLSWDRRRFQQQLLGEIDQQLSFADRLVVSYGEQFQVGRRSLLDVLDAYNTRYNVRVVSESARYAILFSEYRLLAATGQLVEVLGLTPPPQHEAYARRSVNVPTAPETLTETRLPPRRPTQ